MPRLFYIHWNKDECLDAARALRAAGHQVQHHFNVDEGPTMWAPIKQTPPDAIVISLARLPLHGRRIAAASREMKALRHVPLVFVDAAPEKVDAMRAEFPGALFATTADLPKTIEQLPREVDAPRTGGHVPRGQAMPHPANPNPRPNTIAKPRSTSGKSGRRGS
jgi:hypothetical protein